MRIKLKCGRSMEKERIIDVGVVEICEDVLIIDSNSYETGDDSKRIYDELFEKGYADLTGYLHNNLGGY